MTTNTEDLRRCCDALQEQVVERRINRNPGGAAVGLSGLNAQLYASEK